VRGDGIPDWGDYAMGEGRPNPGPLALQGLSWVLDVEITRKVKKLKQLLCHIGKSYFRLRFLLDQEFAIHRLRGT